MTNLANAFLNPIEHVVIRLPEALLTFLVGFIAVQAVLMGVSILFRTLKLTRALQDILGQTIGTILWMVLLASVLQSLGMGRVIIALSGSVALLGIALAAGGNKLLNDLVAGVTLAKNRNFKIGQRVKIESIEGKIHSVDARKVRVLGDDDALYVIPNAKFDELIWQVLPDKDKK